MNYNVTIDQAALDQIRAMSGRDALFWHKRLTHHFSTLLWMRDFPEEKVQRLSDTYQLYYQYFYDLLEKMIFFLV